jgi:hypothetical protein
MKGQQLFVGDDNANPLPYKLTAGNLDPEGFSIGGVKILKAQMEHPHKRRNLRRWRESRLRRLIWACKTSRKSELKLHRIEQLREVIP